MPNETKICVHADQQAEHQYLKRAAETQGVNNRLPDKYRECGYPPIYAIFPFLR